MSLRVLGCVSAVAMMLLAVSDAALAQAKFLGCFSENRNIDLVGTRGRVLADFCTSSNETYRSSGNCAASPPMTVQHCVSACQSRGYAYAGVQYGHWCFCGNDLKGAPRATNCDVRCAGDSSQTCGGDHANSVYSARASAQRVPSAADIDLGALYYMYGNNAESICVRNGYWASRARFHAVIPQRVPGLRAQDFAPGGRYEADGRRLHGAAEPMIAQRGEASWCDAVRGVLGRSGYNADEFLRRVR